MDPARHRDCDQDADLQRRDRKCDEQVADNKQAARIGAVSSSGCAPLMRSTITLSPENIVFRGISSPTVPIATKDS